MSQGQQQKRMYFRYSTNPSKKGSNNRIKIYSKNNLQKEQLKNGRSQSSLSKNAEMQTKDSILEAKQMLPPSTIKITKKQIEFLCYQYDQKIKHLIKQHFTQVEELHSLISANQKLLMQKDEQVNSLSRLLNEAFKERDRLKCKDGLVQKIQFLERRVFDCQKRINNTIVQMETNNINNLKLNEKIQSLQKTLIKLGIGRINKLKKQVMTIIHNNQQKLQNLVICIPKFEIYVSQMASIISKYSNLLQSQYKVKTNSTNLTKFISEDPNKNSSFSFNHNQTTLLSKFHSNSNLNYEYPNPSITIQNQSHKQIQRQTKKSIKQSDFAISEDLGKSLAFLEDYEQVEEDVDDIEDDEFFYTEEKLIIQEKILSKQEILKTGQLRWQQFDDHD